MEHWSKIPPTDKEIAATHNGYFWIRTQIAPETVDADGVWPATYLIEAVQILWEWTTADERAIFTNKTGNIVHLDELNENSGYEWQPIQPPLGVGPNDV